MRLVDLRWERIDAGCRPTMRPHVPRRRETLRLVFARFYPELEGDYACIASNSENKTFTQTIAIREQRVSAPPLFAMLLCLLLFSCALAAQCGPQSATSRGTRASS